MDEQTMELDHELCYIVAIRDDLYDWFVGDGTNIPATNRVSTFFDVDQWEAE